VALPIYQKGYLQSEGVLGGCYFFYGIKLRLGFSLNMSVICKKVAIIGAGPSGLAAARHFGAPESPFECQVFEQADDLGGSWRLSEYIGTDDIGRKVHSSMYKNLR